MTKKDDEDFENSIKSWTCNNIYVDKDVKACVCNFSVFKRQMYFFIISNEVH